MNDQRRAVRPRELLPKLLALLAAFCMWFYASADRRAITERTYDVPVAVRDETVTSGEETRTYSGISPETIKVTLSGKPGRLAEISPERIEAVVSITSLPEGSFNQAVNVDAPSGVSLVSVEPERVQGSIDRVESKDIRVTVALPFEADRALAPLVRAEPSEVRVAGPSRLVKTIAQVAHPPVALAEGGRVSVALHALDEDGLPVTGVVLDPDRVELTREKNGNAVLKSVPVRLADLPPSLRLVSAEFSPPSVRLVGSAEALDKVGQIAAEIDLAPGKAQGTARLRLPLGVVALDGVSATVEVEQIEAPSPAPKAP